MLIGGLQKLTLIDYPGNVACTVFLIGCNFRCAYCHNSELVLPKEIKKQPRISETEFFNFLKERRGLLAGVVLSGGEPTIHKELPNFIKKIKKFGYLVKLDTNGSNPAMLKKLINEKLVDYAAMDIKAPLGLKFQIPNYKLQTNSKFQIKNSKPEISKYEKVTGVNVNLGDIKKSIEIIKSSNIDYEFRSTILPRLHNKESVVDMARWVQGATVYYLQQFRPEKTIDIGYERYKPFNQDEIELIAKDCNKYVNTKLRG